MTSHFIDWFSLHGGIDLQLKSIRHLLHQVVLSHQQDLLLRRHPEDLASKGIRCDVWCVLDYNFLDK